MQRVPFYFAVVFLVIILGVNIVVGGDTSVFNVNILDDRTPTSIISIQVPEKVYFGNVSEGGVSEEIKVYVNNTGNVGINVRPILKNGSDIIMDNLYFRSLKTSGGEPVAFNRIGDFSFNISAPTTGGYRSEYFYVILNLSNVNVTSDWLDYESEIRFDVFSIN